MLVGLYLNVNGLDPSESELLKVGSKRHLYTQTRARTVVTRSVSHE